MKPTRRVAIAVGIATAALVGAGLLLKRNANERHASGLVDDVNALTNRVLVRPVHRQPAHEGDFSRCISTILHTAPAGVADTPVVRRICRGQLTASQAPNELLLWTQETEPFRRAVFECLHETQVSSLSGVVLTSEKSLQWQEWNHLRATVIGGACPAVSRLLEAGQPDVALRECADQFAFLRDGLLAGVGNQAEDAADAAADLVPLCRFAIGQASREAREESAGEFKRVREGIPVLAQLLEDFRVEHSFKKYRPQLSAEQRARLPAPLAAPVGFDDRDSLLAIMNSRWSWPEFDRQLKAGVAAADGGAPLDTGRFPAAEVSFEYITKNHRRFVLLLDQLIDGAEVDPARALRKTDE